MINIETLATKSIPELNELLAAVQYVIGAKTLGLPIATAIIDEQTVALAPKEARTVDKSAKVVYVAKYTGPSRVEERLAILRKEFPDGTIFKAKRAAAVLQLSYVATAEFIKIASKNGIITTVHECNGLYCFGEPKKGNGRFEGEFYSWDDAAKFALERIESPFEKCDLEKILGPFHSGRSMQTIIEAMKKYVDVTMHGVTSGASYTITKRDTRVSKVIADIIALQLHDTVVHPSVHDLAVRIGASRELTQKGLDVMRAQLAFGVQARVDGLAISSPAE